MDKRPYLHVGDRLLILLDIILLLPIRIKRLFLHITYFWAGSSLPPIQNLWDYLFDLPFYLLDILGFPEIYQFSIALVRPYLRHPDTYESQLLEDFFGEEIITKSIWINDLERLVTKNKVIAYVGCNIIHFNESLPPHILIHEAVHVLQYRKYGSVYAGRSLRAQMSSQVYDYGGIFGLSDAYQSNKPHRTFNFEQQAQIIEDYYQVLHRSDLLHNPAIFQVYQHYFDNMRRDLLTSENDLLQPSA